MIPSTTQGAIKDNSLMKKFQEAMLVELAEMSLESKFLTSTYLCLLRFLDQKSWHLLMPDECELRCHNHYLVFSKICAHCHHQPDMITSAQHKFHASASSQTTKYILNSWFGLIWYESIWSKRQTSQTLVPAQCLILAHVILKEN